MTKEDSTEHSLHFMIVEELCTSWELDLVRGKIAQVLEKLLQNRRVRGTMLLLLFFSPLVLAQ